MGKGEMIEIHLENEQKARQSLVQLQNEAAIHAQRLALLAQRLNQLARESATGLTNLNNQGMALDSDLQRAIASYPSKETLNSVITGMITNAGTVELERAELRKLNVQPASGDNA